MKFIEIVDLQAYFQPVFNMENETVDYWKQFIPNEKFYEILEKTVLAVSSAQIKNKLSIWMVGRYGTGKSHASSVIKHLLWDDTDNLNDYINERILKINIKEKVKAFRKDKKILPVILKGGGNVTDARTLSLEIERAVKKSLKQYNINIQTKSDFDKIIEKVNDSFLNWDSIIIENTDLEMYVTNKEDIVNKLGSEDIEFLKIVERILSKKNIHFSHEKIAVWLSEVSKELIDKGLASGLMVFWDEFTTILEKDTISEIINEIQSIAELSPKDNVYLYLISHRDYNQFGKNIQDVLAKVKDRFHNLQYPMIPVTTYQILSAALQKKYPDKWEKLKNAVFENTKLDGLVKFITQNIDGTNTENSIKNLYPIHPYTVYLSTFLANNIGSTQRSIFNFIYDSEFGFIKFLNSEVNDETLLTADLLWDFYAEELDRDKDNRFMQVLEKYNAYKTQTEKKSPYYLKVFKGVLLLNSLYRITDYLNPETDKIKPHIINIKNLFIGTDIENSVNGALEYIDKQEIIQKNPNELFEISSTSLPRQEVDAEKENLKNQYKDIIKLIEFDRIKDKLERFFNEENGILRKTRVKFFTSDTNLHILKSNLSKNFSPSYFLDFAVFLKLNNDENDKVENLIAQIKQEEDFKHIVFINVLEPLGEDKYKKFIEYLARANVFRNHSYNNKSAKEEEFAAKILNRWVNRIAYVDVYINFLTGKIIRDIKQLGQYINDDMAPKIFNNGIDSIISSRIKINTVWKFQASRSAIENIIKVEKREDIEKLTGPLGYLKDIFKDKDSDYIIDNDLKIKNDTIPHPVIKVFKKVKNKIDEASKKPAFNLAEELKFLMQPPYGLYTNILNMAVLGYAFRDFVGKLYIANSGVLIDTIAMRDKVNEIFECWQRKKACDKLNVRLGSEEEKELINELATLFNIENCTGLQDVRWKIRDKIKNISFPIWSLKFGNIQYESQKTIIDNINKIVFELTDSEVDINFVKTLLSNIQNNRFDLQQIINSDKNFKKGFINFLSVKGKDKISENKINEVITYIRHNQPEELNWKEKDVENSILKYIIEKESKPAPQPPNNAPVPPSDISPTPPKSETIKNVKKKIENIKDINSLKDKILRVLEERPDIADILDKYL